jgi:succinate dehydrogenase / fumarate reductase cytochrome b subunit
MNIGAYMFVFHRLSGVVLTVYLFVHLFTLGSALQGPDGYDRMMALLNNPAVRGLELVLVWLVLYHTFNGVRLVLLQVVPGLDQRRLAHAALGLSLLAIVLSIPFFFSLRL